MTILRAAKPFIATCTYEQDPDTEERNVLDINSFAVPAQTATDEEVAKWRSDMLKYVGEQIDLIIDGSAADIRIEGRLS